MTKKEDKLKNENMLLKDSLDELEEAFTVATKALSVEVVSLRKEVERANAVLHDNFKRAEEYKKQRDEFLAVLEYFADAISAKDVGIGHFKKAQEVVYKFYGKSPMKRVSRS
jgi:hypothetical protein